ncbi:class I SAM-dependent methyltransferase [Streptomyces winkii]|uniref:class I SAM-dependent methyltransferase n=1 Tax=Streptomyces winkii TaxID=3051178 RepID=UPI0028D72072|nr:class I SAM-dependent methyltransferase [Streptomyces sp. DSM 40971]
MSTAEYDQIADWYEEDFLGRQDAATTDGNPRSLNRLLGGLLGTGSGTCLEIGCGTGIHAAPIRDRGWTPVGVDLSRRMLGYARDRLPVAQADAERLPVRSNSVPAAVAVMVHTDMPRYPTVVHEAARILHPGGVFVHIGVHPCFCGAFADRSEPDAIVVRPGYLDGAWTKTSWTNQGVRDKVGATHLPLPHLMHAFLDAGLVLERFAEHGTPTPIVMAVTARKPGRLPTSATARSHGPRTGVASADQES